MPEQRLVAPPQTPLASPDQLKQIELAYQMASDSSQFKGGYLTRTSHELRSPLNGLIGMHQLILSNLCDSPEEERDFIAQANASAQKMVTVLDRIVDVARVQHGTTKLEIEPVQLAQVLQSVHDVTHLQAKDRNIRLAIVPPASDIYVEVDFPRFRQVLINLVDSAILRLPEDGITVEAELPPGARYVHIWINDHCPASARSESVNLPQINLPDGSDLPSPGLNLLADQILLQTMNGKLEVLEIDAKNSSPSDSPDRSLTQIRCSIPGYRSN